MSSSSSHVGMSERKGEEGLEIADTQFPPKISSITEKVDEIEGKRTPHHTNHMIVWCNGQNVGVLVANYFVSVYFWPFLVDPDFARDRNEEMKREETKGALAPPLVAQASSPEDDDVGSKSKSLNR